MPGSAGPPSTTTTRTSKSSSSPTPWTRRSGSCWTCASRWPRWRTRWSGWPSTCAPRWRTSAAATCRRGRPWAAVLSPASFAKLADHVGELSVLLQGILRDGMAQGYLPEADIAQLAQLIHGTLSSSAARGRRRRPGPGGARSPGPCGSSSWGPGPGSTTPAAPSALQQPARRRPARLAAPGRQAVGAWRGHDRQLRIIHDAPALPRAAELARRLVHQLAAWPVP